MSETETHTYCAQEYITSCRVNAEWAISDPGNQYASVYACTSHRDAVATWFYRVTKVRADVSELTL